MSTECGKNNFKEKDNLEDLSVDGTTDFKLKTSGAR
jgi:hypothetical protein